jgi:hypothetical protein
MALAFDDVQHRDKASGSARGRWRKPWAAGLDHGHGDDGSRAATRHTEVRSHLAGWGWASGRISLSVRYCCIGSGPIQHPNNFPNIQTF